MKQLQLRILDIYYEGFAYPATYFIICQNQTGEYIYTNEEKQEFYSATTIEEIVAQADAYCENMHTKYVLKD